MSTSRGTSPRASPSSRAAAIGTIRRSLAPPGGVLQPILRTVNLTKYHRRTLAVVSLNLELYPGEIYGLVGPNGAGKTTVIRLLTGLSFPSKGRVEVLGQDIHRSAPRAMADIGAVVEAPATFYPFLTGRQNLELLAGLSGGVRAGRIERVLDEVQLKSQADRRTGEYSLGMKQRLGLAGAIVAEPALLILDEPTSGMDPEGIDLVYEVLHRAAERGAAILLSTHHLPEAARNCTKVGILDQGKLIDQIDLAGKRGAAILIRVDRNAEARALLDTEPAVKRSAIHPEGVLIDITEESRLPEVVQVLVASGFRVSAVGPERFDLLGYFRKRVKELV